MDNATDLSNLVQRLKGQQHALQKQLKAARSSAMVSRRAVKTAEEVSIFLQKVAKMTQDQLCYQVTEIGTMALKAVFDGSMELDMTFTERRGKTEADIQFYIDGNYTNPTEEDSGGAADIAALALRCSMWTLRLPKLQNTIILDEPLKNINDPTREMHRKAAEMLRLISDKLGIQFIITTMLPELEDVADNVIQL